MHEVQYFVKCIITVRFSLFFIAVAVRGVVTEWRFFVFGDVIPQVAVFVGLVHSISISA